MPLTKAGKGLSDQGRRQFAHPPGAVAEFLVASTRELSPSGLLEKQPVLKPLRARLC